MIRLPPAGNTSGAKRRDGIWLSGSPGLLVLVVSFVLIAAVGIYLALPKYEISGLSTIAMDSQPATSAVESKPANQPNPPKNAFGDHTTTRHAVYGTSDANNSAANDSSPSNLAPNSPAPTGSNVEPHLVQTTSIPGDPHKVRTTRVDTTPAAAGPVPKPFTIANDTEVIGDASDAMSADSTADCEQKCAKSPSACNLFSFNKETQQCLLYTSGELRKNPLFDYGVRNRRGIHSETVRRDDGGNRTVPFPQQNR